LRKFIMRGHAVMLMAATVASFALFAAPAAAQQRCPEGRTAAGVCVNPPLAQGMRKRVIVYTQPKFSHTAPLVMPSGDRVYQVPRDYHEVDQLFTFPPITTVTPGGVR
jgi:hypothetical protein